MPGNRFSCTESRFIAEPTARSYADDRPWRKEDHSDLASVLSWIPSTTTPKNPPRNHQLTSPACTPTHTHNYVIYMHSKCYYAVVLLVLISLNPNLNELVRDLHNFICIFISERYLGFRQYLYAYVFL